MTEALSHLRSSVSRAVWGPSARALVEPYGIAIIGVALALALRTALASVLEGAASYLFYVPAILVASALGGWGPGRIRHHSRPVDRVVLRRRLSRADSRRHRQRFRLRAGRRRRFVARRIVASFAHRGGGKRARSAGARNPHEAHPRHHSRRHDRDRRARHHAILQRGGGAAVRLQRGRGARQERQDADADALSRKPRRLSRSLPADRRAAHHRHRPGGGRRAQGRLDLSARAQRRRDEDRSATLFHRLHPRSHRAAEDRGATAGAAVRAGTRLAPDRHGRDGIGAGARAQPAAVGDRQLHEGLAPAA